jgi:hypothetical protein
VTIIALGGPDTEDEFFAQTLADHLSHKPISHDTICTHLLTHPRSARFFDPTVTWSPEEDAHLAVMIDRFDFFCLLERKHTPARLVKRKA